MKPSPEIEEIMWRLAEAPDDSEHGEFLARYPEFQAEFEKRIAMVRGLKGSRPKSAKRRTDFMPSPRTLAADSAPSRWAVVGAATLVLAGTVLATLGAVRYMDARQGETARQAGPVPPVGPGHLDQGGPENGQMPVSNQGGQKKELPETVVPPSPFDSLVTIVATRVKLSTCLDDIARQAGIRLESAPGMDTLDVDVEVDYRGVPALSALDDLGRNFKFSVLRQTESSALLVPAVDPKKEQSGDGVGTSGPSTPPAKGGDAGLSPVGTEPAAGGPR